MTGLMREAVRVGDKGILENRKSNSQLNVGSDVPKAHQDYMDELQSAEAAIAKFNYIGNKRVFKNYFKLTKDLDSEKLCDYIDSYQIGQNGGILLFE